MNKIVTHGTSNFHTDDVFAVAVLDILLKGDIEVIRTLDKDVINTADFVVDIGLVYDPEKNRFDHHQEGGAGFRDNKIAYSSFGLLWKTYGEKICGSKKIADILDKKLVTIIDADDDGFDLYLEKISGVEPFMLTDVIYSMRPTWKEDDLDIDEVFLKAVAFAKEILLREIKITKDNTEAESLIEEVYKNTKDKRVIIFDKVFLPKELLVIYPEPLFVVYESRNKQMWRVMTIEKRAHLSEVRKNFPESWWGKKSEELAEITGIPDVIFCRNRGIFAGVKSKEGAIKLAELAIKN